MSDAKGWLGGALGSIVMSTVALAMYLFGKGRTTMKKNVEKIREALRFAADAAVPRVQAEATLALVEVTSELLDEMKEQGDDLRSGKTQLVAQAGRAEARNVEELELLRDMQRLLRKVAGEPEPTVPETAENTHVRDE